MRDKSPLLPEFNAKSATWFIAIMVVVYIAGMFIDLSWNWFMGIFVFSFLAWLVYIRIEYGYWDGKDY